jgi:hypothetical protein
LRETVQALLIQGDGGYISEVGHRTVPGAFEIDNVPDNVAYFLADGDFMTETTSRTPELGTPLIGRSNVILIDPTQVTDPVALQLTNFLPIEPGQIIEFSALNDGIINFDTEDYLVTLDGGTVQPGDVTMEGTIDWANINDLDLESAIVDSTQGDTLFVAQLVAQDGGDNGATVDNVLSRFLDLTGQTITEAGDDVLVGALVDVPMSEPLAINVPRTVPTETDFTSGISYLDSVVDVGVLPGSDTYGAYQGFPDLLISQSTAAGPSPYALNTSFGNPYPAAWPEIVTVKVEYGLPLVVDNAHPNGTYVARARYELDSTVGNLPATYTPSLGPVRSIQINGLDANVDLTRTTTTPTISWQPPAVGTPTAYRVALIRLAYNINAQAVIREYFFSIDLPPTTTSVTIPLSLIDPSHKWYIEVDAISEPNSDLTQAPFHSSLPYEIVQNLTHFISP